MEKKFEIRTYGFGELGQLYLPRVSKTSASKMFSSWIYGCPELIEGLQASEWKKRQKYFTPKQVRILINHFDPPY